MSDKPSALSRWSRLKHRADAEKKSSADAVADAVIEEAELEVQPQVDIGVQLDGMQVTPDLPAVTEGVDSDPSGASIENHLAPDQSDQSDQSSDEPLLSDEDMPALATLTPQSDISMFFNRGVSTTLRKAAFKYVFQLPQYNLRDGLNDYDEDYTVFEPLGDTITCDMKFHTERKEREAREAEEREALLAQQEQDASQQQDESVEDGSDKVEQTAESDAAGAEASDEAANSDLNDDTEKTPDTDDLDTTENSTLHADAQLPADPITDKLDA